ncbi:MAG: metalloregulator ArsR/SmtB family transcription factor [Candidatus Humimicrobiaceae bacterium]
MDIERSAQLLKALAHPTRLLILKELYKDKKCVNAIEEILEIRQPNISQHLNLLRLNGIVDYEKQGNRKCYFLINPEFVKNIFAVLENYDNGGE